MAISTDARADSSHLGKSFHFKGEISGTEDIYIDGHVEGTIQLTGQAVTVGPQGTVHAQIHARELTVHGKLQGNAEAHDRIEISRTGSVVGDLSMTRISIQDGAFMQGRVDIRTEKAADKPVVRVPEKAQEVAPEKAMAATATGPFTFPQQSSLLERKP